MPDGPATLAQVEAAVWDELERAVQGKARDGARSAPHGWRTPVLATVDGDAADARTVVLRSADRAERRLTIFTDRRAAKVAQLMSRPHATFVMWSAALAWQLRCRAVLTVRASDDAANAALWARIQRSPAARDYLSELSPGTALGGDAPGAEESGHATGDGRENFVVIDARVQSIDWLELHPSGHRRAVFEGGGARWVQP